MRNERKELKESRAGAEGKRYDLFAILSGQENSSKFISGHRREEVWDREPGTNSSGLEYPAISGQGYALAAASSIPRSRNTGAVRALRTLLQGKKVPLGAVT